MLNSDNLRALLRNPLILPVYVPSLIFAFCQGLLIPVLPLYAVDFGVSYGLVGVLLAGEGLGQLLGDVPAGMILRRLGHKKAMLLGVGLSALMTVLLFWAGSIPHALIYRVASGFGVAMFSIARHAYMAEAVIIGNRGRAIAVFGGVNRIGKFAAPAIGGVVGGLYGLRAPFLLFGGCCLLVVIILIIARHLTISVTSEVGMPQHSTAHFLHTIKAQYRVLATAGLGQLFAQTIRAGRAVIIPLYGADVLGLDVAQIGFIVSIAAAVDMTLFYPAGWVMDHWGRKFAIVPCFLVQALAMATVPFTTSFLTLLAAASLIGFGNGLGSGTMMTLGADLAPRESRGEFLGLWRLIGDIGFTGAPLVVGGVASLLVLSSAAWAIAGAGLMSVIMFGFFVPETLVQRLAVGSAET